MFELENFRVLVSLVVPQCPTQIPGADSKPTCDPKCDKGFHARSRCGWLCRIAGRPETNAIQAAGNLIDLSGGFQM